MRLCVCSNVKAAAGVCEAGGLALKSSASSPPLTSPYLDLVSCSAVETRGALPGTKKNAPQPIEASPPVCHPLTGKPRAAAAAARVAWLREARGQRCPPLHPLFDHSIIRTRACLPVARAPPPSPPSRYAALARGARCVVSLQPPIAARWWRRPLCADLYSCAPATPPQLFPLLQALPSPATPLSQVLVHHMIRSKSSRCALAYLSSPNKPPLQ